MKKLIFILTLIYSVFLMQCCVYAYNVEKIADEIKSFSPDIYVASGDVNKVLSDTFNYDPRLLMYYRGYEGYHAKFTSMINIVYTNKEVDLKDVYVAENKEEFISLITRAMLYSNEKLYVVAKNMPDDNSAVKNCISEVSRLCPIAFMGYRSNTSSIINTKINGYSCYTLNFKYDFEKEKLNQMKRELEQKACEIVASNIAKDMPPYLKVYIIHNYIINNCKYAEDYETNDDLLYYTAYGVLVNGSAVCDGYTSAAQILFNICGIENIKVSGTARDEGHAWNLVKLDDDYYHIDITWDDPVRSDGLNSIKYNYYNINDDEIAKDHNWEKNKYPAAKGNIYNYEKTLELIMKDKTNYSQGYESFTSVFATYKPLNGSTTGGFEATTEISTYPVIEPSSVLDKADSNTNIFANDLFSCIVISIKNNPSAYAKGLAVFIVLIILLKIIFRRE